MMQQLQKPKWRQYKVQFDRSCFYLFFPLNPSFKVSFSCLLNSAPRSHCCSQVGDKFGFPSSRLPWSFKVIRPLKATESIWAIFIHVCKVPFQTPLNFLLHILCKIKLLWPTLWDLYFSILRKKSSVYFVAMKVQTIYKKLPFVARSLNSCIIFFSFSVLNKQAFSFCHHQLRAQNSFWQVTHQFWVTVNLTSSSEMILMPTLQSWGMFPTEPLLQTESKFLESPSVGTPIPKTNFNHWEPWVNNDHCTQIGFLGVFFASQWSMSHNFITKSSNHRV